MEVGPRPKAERFRSRFWGRGRRRASAPCGASVPGASVPGRGRSGRSSSVSQLPPRSASPQAHLPKAVRNAKGNHTSPKCGPFALEAPRSPTRQRSLLPQPRFSPRALAGTRAETEGLLPRGPNSLRLLSGDPPLQKKKARARTEWQGGRAVRYASPGASHARTRLRVPSGRGSSCRGVSLPPRLFPRPPPGMGKKSVPAESRRIQAGTPGKGSATAPTLSEASRPPPPALTYLLHLVMVELREEVGEQMRGDHPAEARRRRVGKPRLERVGGRRAARSHSFVPERGGPTGSGESGRPTKRANSDGAPS